MPLRKVSLEPQGTFFKSRPWQRPCYHDGTEQLGRRTDGPEREAFTLGSHTNRAVGSILRKVSPLAGLVLLQTDVDKDAGTEFGEFADGFKEAE